MKIFKTSRISEVLTGQGALSDLGVVGRHYHEEVVRHKQCARGDVKWFVAYTQNSGNNTNSVSLQTDTLKLAVIGNGTTVSMQLAYPTWGTAGSTNLSSFEVGTGSVYVAGGITLATVTWSLSNTTVLLDAADITWAQDLAGFGTGYWGIIYSNTAPRKDAVIFLDLGGPVGISAGALTITWASGGIANRVVS